MLLAHPPHSAFVPSLYYPAALVNTSNTSLGCFLTVLNKFLSCLHLYQYLLWSVGMSGQAGPLESLELGLWPMTPITQQFPSNISQWLGHSFTAKVPLSDYKQSSSYDFTSQVSLQAGIKCASDLDSPSNFSRSINKYFGLFNYFSSLVSVGFYLESDFSQETETNHWQEVITQSQML
jgi:hypothetical protein